MKFESQVHTCVLHKSTMQWKTVVQQFAVFAEYASLWHGPLSDECVTILLNSQPVDTLIIYDRIDAMTYPHLFSIAIKTLTGIKFEDVFVCDHAFATYATSRLHAEHSIDNMLMWLIQTFVILSPWTQVSVDTSFYRRICDEYNMFQCMLPLGFYTGDLHVIQTEVNTTTNAVVVASGPVKFLQLARLVVSNSLVSYVLNWGFDGLFTIADDDQTVVECCSAQEALQQFILKKDLVLYNAFSLQRLAYRALSKK